MKRWTLLVCAVALCVSCVTIPKPEGSNSSLVVGKFVLDFPDGFFGQSPTTLENHVKLMFRDTTENAALEVYTQAKGYYYFAAKAGHPYVLESWSASITRGNQRSSLGPAKIGWRFNVGPGQIAYLGDIMVTFRAPNRTSQVGRSSAWHYDIEVDLKHNPTAVKEFFAELDPESQWLTYGVVTTPVERPRAE